MILTVAARSSNLSKRQVEEILREIKVLHPVVTFEIVHVQTKGDLDRTTSLRSLDKTDFFTDEVDRMLLQKKCRIAIHSAKDLPHPMADGLQVIAITKGVNPSDSLVFPKGQKLDKNAVVATSSLRREEVVQKLFPNVRFTDLRGTIEERLAKIDGKKIHGVVVAEAALIRLGLTHLHRVTLPGKTTPLQGQLALVARKDDEEMQRLFFPLDFRKKTLYLGLDPSRFLSDNLVIHYPVIATKPRSNISVSLEKYTHVIFTSKMSVLYFPKLHLLQGKVVIAIGKVTAAFLQERGVKPLVAKEATQEGIIELLKTMNLQKASIFYPRSSKARPCLIEYFTREKISYKAVDLYDTVCRKQAPIDLSYIDELVFTSPSTIEGLLKIYSTIPEHLKITTIGPITDKMRKQKGF